MNFKLVSRYLSWLLFIFAIFVSAPLLLAIYDDSQKAKLAYGVTFLSVLVCALILRVYGSKDQSTVGRLDAFGIVAFIWIAVGFFGAMPFLIEGSIVSVPSAVFEAVSGFTTTGATVLADVEKVSRATNLWRCISHWIGGMGIVVLFIAIFPQLGVGAKHLFKTEVPGPISEGLKPRIKQTAIRLWWLYAALTATCGGALFLLGMSKYDAFCHALSILSTGGFSTKSASIGAFSNPAIDWTVSLFMFLGGLNFGLYYTALHGRLSVLWTNYEARFFFAVNVVVSTIIALFLWPKFGDFLTALRFGLFQTLAVTTTTGLMTDDFDKYPDLARLLLFFCMFMGGCAGSTAGGIKASRVFIAIKSIAREMKQVLHPQMVVSLKVGNQPVSNQIVTSIFIFIAAYFSIFIVGSILLAALGVDLLTAMSAVVACLSSVGPGLAGVGPVQNFEFIPAFGKLILCFCMIAGRLEIFAFFVLFKADVWKR